MPYTPLSYWTSFKKPNAATSEPFTWLQTKSCHPKHLFSETIDAWQDKFVKRCRSITEQITEETAEIEGEWLTEEDMKLLKYSEFLSCTRAQGDFTFLLSSIFP